MNQTDIPLHGRQASMSTLVGNSFHVPSLMAMLMMLFQSVMPAVARPLSPEQEKQLHSRLKYSCFEPDRAVLTPGILTVDDVIEHMHVHFKVIDKMSAAPWFEVRDDLHEIPLCDLESFFVYQRMDRPTGVLGPSWSSQKRRAFSSASFVFQRATGLGLGRNQFVAKQLPSLFPFLCREMKTWSSPL